MINSNCQQMKGFFTMSPCDKPALAVCPVCNKNYCAKHRASQGACCVNCAKDSEQSDMQITRNRYQRSHSNYLYYHGRHFGHDEVESFEQSHTQDAFDQDASVSESFDDSDLFDS